MTVDLDFKFLPQIVGDAQAQPEGVEADDGLDHEDPATREAIDRKKFGIRVGTAAQREVRREDNPPSPLPPILTLRQRLALPVEAAKYRIDRLQPTDARIVLSAQYKSGKTTMVGNLLRSLVDGDPFLDRYDVEAVEGNVGLIDFEMSGRQLDEWLGEQKIVNDDRIIVFPLRGAASSFDIADEDIRKQWAQRLKERGIKYLIWDCFRPVVDALGLEEKSAGHLLTAFDELLKLAEIPEAVVVHHMGHFGERSRGDSRLRDWPDVEWTIVREDPEDPASKRYFKAFGRDVDEREAALSFDTDTRHLTIAEGLAGGSRKDAAVRDALNAVMAVLDEEGGISGRQIEERVKERGGDHAQKDVRSATKNGIKAGWIVTVEGPKRAILHTAVSPSASVRQSASPVRQRTPESECVSASVRVVDALHSRTPGRSGEQSAPRSSADALCRDCGDPLDPVLAEGGHHIGCETAAA